MVVTHGGLGTVTEVLRRGLRVVGVSNPDRFDRHQDQILQAFEQAGHLVWCRDLAGLPAAIEQARQAQFVPTSRRRRTSTGSSIVSCATWDSQR